MLSFWAFNHYRLKSLTDFIFFFQAIRNAVLTRSKEHADIRQKTMENSTAIYDLLTITLARHAQFETLSEVSSGLVVYSTLPLLLSREGSITTNSIV